MIAKLGGAFVFYTFPSMTPRMDVDTRMKLLDEYLQKIVKPALMIDALLDFLNIPINDRKP